MSVEVQQLLKDTLVAGLVNPLLVVIALLPLLVITYLLKQLVYFYEVFLGLTKGGLLL